MKNTLTQLYWPKSSLNKEGYIIGWPVHGFICCIITISAAPFSHLKQVLSRIGEKAEILGTVGKDLENSEGKTKSDLWITAEVVPDSVLITEVHCCGYKYRTNAHVIFFDDTVGATDPVSLVYPSVFYRKIINYSNKLKKPELSPFQLVSEKINRSRFVAKLVKKSLGPDDEDNLKNCAGFLFMDVVNYLVFIMKALAEIVFYGVSYRLPVIGLSLSCLPLRSQLIHQLTSRVHLLQIWENNRRHLKPKYSGPYLSRLYADSFLRTNSALFTIVIDFIFGLVFLCLLNYFSADTLKIVHTLGSTLHIEVLKSEVNWLMGLPAGFKPNEALDNAVGFNILRLIDCWNLVTTYLTGFEIQIVQFFAVFGLFGISFQLALLSDLIDFCTLHM
jgi:hypothetical protein